MPVPLYFYLSPFIHTCADYARDVFYKAKGKYLDTDDYLGFETPGELAKSLGNWI